MAVAGEHGQVMRHLVIQIPLELCSVAQGSQAPQHFSHR